jgi:hypothetical protein
VKVLNAIPRENAADYRRVLTGQPLKRIKRKEPVKAYVSQFHKFDPRNSTHTLQLPIAFRTAEYNAGRTHPALRARWVKEKRELVWRVMHAHMPTFARCIPEGISLRVTHIEFVRIGMRKLDDDNLVAAFKAVRDALCSFLVWGHECDENIRQIGRADDILKQRGVSWSYKQQKCERNPRAYGVKLVLHCAPRSSE